MDNQELPPDSPHSPPPPSPSYKYVPDHMISMLMWPNAVLISKKINFLFLCVE